VLYNLYGFTEAGWAALATPADLRSASDTVGRPPRGATVRIEGADGREQPACRVGRVLVGGLTFGTAPRRADGLHGGQHRDERLRHRPERQPLRCALGRTGRPGGEQHQPPRPPRRRRHGGTDIPYQYTDALSARPVPPVVIRTDFREQGGYDATASLLSAPERPDAVFVANNLMTVGALHCLADRDVAVPGEMGVVGFDEIPWADLVRPSLTTVVQPTYELGRMAARLLVDRIATPAGKPATVTLPPELRPRQSSVR
jgi:hypothetical protein